MERRAVPVLHGVVQKKRNDAATDHGPRMYDNGYFITFYPEIGYLLVLECPIVFGMYLLPLTTASLQS